MACRSLENVVLQEIRNNGATMRSQQELMYDLDRFAPGPVPDERQRLMLMTKCVRALKGRYQKVMRDMRRDDNPAILAALERFRDRIDEALRLVNQVKFGDRATMRGVYIEHKGRGLEEQRLKDYQPPGRW